VVEREMKLQNIFREPIRNNTYFLNSILRALLVLEKNTNGCSVCLYIWIIANIHQKFTPICFIAVDGSIGARVHV
jgi:hypothetical protein